jgi:hypothetical protein
MKKRYELMKAGAPNASSVEEMAINDTIADLDARLAGLMREYRNWMYPEEAGDSDDCDDDQYSDYDYSDYSDYY